MTALLYPELAITEALGYGSAAHLDARRRRWDRRETFLCYVLPGILVLAVSLVFVSPMLLGRLALDHPSLLGLLVCLLTMGAFTSHCLSLELTEDYWCAPIRAYIDSGNMAEYLESPGARKLHDAVLASGRELYWVDVWLIERVIAYERLQHK